MATDLHPFGPHPLFGIGVDELRWLAPVRPDDVLHIEGEVVELTPSKTKAQGVKVKWTAFNDRVMAVPIYTHAEQGCLGWRGPKRAIQLIMKSRQYGTILVYEAPEPPA